MKKYVKYIIPMVIVALLLSVIYVIKGIYPFGSNSIAQADLAQAYVPAYSWLYDALHGNTGLLYNYDIGAGANMYGSLVLNALYSPVSWLIAICERSNIINFFSILLMIRLSLIALTSFICFDKIFKKTNLFYKTLFSIIYAFSGYVFLGYSNIQWLDNVVLFPLLVLSLKYLFDKGKVLPFIIVMTINLIFTFYISYMVLLFVVFASFSALIFYVKKEDRKKTCLKLILGIGISLGLSAFSFLPAFFQSATSHRIANMSLKGSDIYLYSKLLYYCCSSIAIYYFLKMKKNNITYCILLTFLFTAIGTFVEPINRMWHTGSYVAFPYRYGFIPLFVLMIGGLHALNTGKEMNTLKLDLKNSVKSDGKWIIIFLILLYGTFLYTYATYKDVKEVMLSIQALSKNLFLELSLCLILFIILVIIANRVKEKVLKYILISIVLMAEVITYGTYYIGFNYEYAQDLNHTDILVNNAFVIKDELELRDTNYLYKDNTQLLTANYPFITQTRALSNWYHIIKSEQLYNHRDLGYSYNYTRLHDIGGTLFSDSLYGIKYILSYDEMDEKIYNLLRTYGDIKLYESKYTLPLVKYNNNLNVEFNKQDAFDNQNLLYKNIFGYEDNVLDIYNYNDLNTVDENQSVKISIKVESSSNIYLYLKDQRAYIYNIKVNGKLINLYNCYNMLYYPNVGNNGIVDLESYDTDVTIEFNYQGDLQGLQFATLEHSKIIELYDKFNKDYELNIKGSNFSIKYDSSDDGYLFVPINYNDGFTAKVNNKPVEISKYLNTYINIPIKKGLNNIEVKFFPPYLKIGIIISVISLILLITGTLINRKMKLEENKIFQNLGLMAYIIMFIGIFIFVNIIGFL